MPRALAEILTESLLRETAGPTYFERGREYFEDEAVSGLKVEGDVLHARVQGNSLYKVKLWAESGRLAYTCACPLGREGTFCKHAVAAGLTWLAQEGKGPPSSGSRISLDEVRNYLEGREKKELVDLISEFAVWDQRLFDRLALRAAQSGGPAPDLKRYRTALRKAIEIRDFVDYRSAYDYTRKAEDAIETLKTLLATGYAKEVIDLAEFAWELLEESQNSMDDSDGHTSELLELLEGIHHEACRKARPDPVELGRRLFRLELHSGVGAFHDAPARYGDVLGEEGKAAYQNAVGEAWAKLPALGPGEKDGDHEGHRFQLTQIVERMAKGSRNVDMQIEIKKRDLSRSWDFRALIELLQEAGRHDECLEWAERGARTFEGYEGDELREMLAWEYHRRGRHEEAMALAWQALTDRPHLQGYRKLKAHAEKVKAWPEWREKALKLIRDETEKEKKRPGRRDSWGGPPDASSLVEIFFWEKDFETAWTEAKTGGSNEPLWLALAEAREQAHPEDALPIHLRHLESALKHADKNAYREVVEILRTIRRIMKRMGRAEDFQTLVLQTRARYARRKNLIALLDREGLEAEK